MCIRDRVKALQADVARYAAAFANMVQQAQSVGLNESQGLLGALRGTVHDVEDEQMCIRDRRRADRPVDAARLRRAEAQANAVRRHTEVRYGAKSWRCQRRVAAPVSYTHLAAPRADTWGA